MERAGGTNQSGGVGCWRYHPCVTVRDARGTTPSLHLQATKDGAGSCETLTCLISATCSKDSSHRGDCSIILFFVGQHSHSHLFVLSFFAHNGGTTLCLCLFWTAE